MTNGQSIGCVVIGRNEGERLVRCLTSVRNSGLPVFYVDSGSSDGSVAVARELGATVVELDMAQPFTAARARNAGYEALKEAAPATALVQFIDGDCDLAPGWIEAARAAIGERPGIAVVCGRRRERYPEASVYNRLCDREWDTPIGEAQACGGDSLMRTAAFDAAGGFRPDIMAGEEPEFCARLRSAGWKIQRIDAEMTLHDAAMTRLKQWWMRAVRSGFGYAQVWSVTRGEPARLYGAQLKRSLLWGGLVPLVLLATIFVHPLLTLAIAALYPLRIVRIALKEGGSKRGGWSYAWFMVLAQIPELYGALKYFARTARTKQDRLIEYK